MVVIHEGDHDTREGKLSTYFVYHRIAERFGFTFNQFCNKVDNGTWEQFIKEHQGLSRR